MIKYRHRNCDRPFTPATFAYVLPSAEIFRQMVMGHHNIINFSFGMTLLHPRDQYCKAIGRKMAEWDLHRGRKSFGVDRIEIRNDRCYFFLRTSDTQKVLEIGVSVDFETMKSRMETIEFV